MRKFSLAYFTVSFSFFLFLFVFFLYGCQKEISFETNTPGVNPGNTSTAVFTLVSFSPGGCADTEVSGTYIAGKALTATNYVLVSVNVSKKGTWSFAKQTVNGISIFGAGEFSDIGNQVIKLQATGTPLKEGTFNFPLKIGSANCSFAITVLPSSATGGNTGTGTLYYKATIGGVNYLQNAIETNGVIAGSGIGGSDDVSLSADILTIPNTSFPNKSAMSITKAVLHNYDNATNAQFKAFFVPGDYPYAKNPDVDNGIYINWQDNDGTEWSTYDGTGDQTGSSFKIVSTVDELSQPNYAVKVKMQFTCKLYKEGTGEMRQLTNGEMVGIFQKF